MEHLYERTEKTNNQVLIVIPGNIDFRGIQVFFHSALINIPMDDVGIDIYFAGTCEQQSMLDDFMKIDVGVYIGNINVQSSFDKNLFLSDMNWLLDHCQYECVHVNSGIPWFNSYAMCIAKQHKIPKRFSHSHSSHIQQKSVLKRAYKEYLTLLNNKNTTHYLACSDSAAKWMFGDRKALEAEILNNGINPLRYKFNPEVRSKMRREYGVENNKVVLHVGAFNKAKNQSFLVDVLKNMVIKDNSVRLFFIGTGDFLPYIKKRICEEKLNEFAIFVGTSNRVCDYMQMADLFVLPSVFEGLGLVNIEAQAAGLRCIVSDVVPESVKITDLLQFVSLDKGSGYWAEKCLMAMDDYRRQDTSDEINKADYSVNSLTKRLHELYCE